MLGITRYVTYVWRTRRFGS